jgi:hypothetical protein
MLVWNLHRSNLVSHRNHECNYNVRPRVMFFDDFITLAQLSSVGFVILSDVVLLFAACQ